MSVYRKSNYLHDLYDDSVREIGVARRNACRMSDEEGKEK
jgi:hypothetical protein